MKKKEILLVILTIGFLLLAGVYGANTGVKHDHTKDSWRSVAGK